NPGGCPRGRGRPAGCGRAAPAARRSCPGAPGRRRVRCPAAGTWPGVVPPAGAGRAAGGGSRAGWASAGPAGAGSRRRSSGLPGAGRCRGGWSRLRAVRAWRQCRPPAQCAQSPAEPESRPRSVPPRRVTGHPPGGMMRVPHRNTGPRARPGVSMSPALYDWLARGLTQASYWQMAAYFLVMVQVTIFTVTLYLHRSAAHRGVDFHPVLAHFFRFWAWLTTAMVTKEWTAVHRKHHAKCETEEDPHSPRFAGINRVLWRGVELY